MYEVRSVKLRAFLPTLIEAIDLAIDLSQASPRFYSIYKDGNIIRRFANGNMTYPAHTGEYRVDKKPKALAASM